MTIAEKKKELRKKMLAERAMLKDQFKENYDDWICEEIWLRIVKLNHRVVHCYLPMGSEINIIPLIDKMLQDGITVVTPKTLPKRQLQHLILNSLHELEKGVFGTSHPANAEEFSGAYDLIIVPGLAFDQLSHRMGYGGGYYDGFLLQHQHAYQLGICYPFQNLKVIPVESYDAQLSEILCKKEGPYL